MNEAGIGCGAVVLSLPGKCVRYVVSHLGCGFLVEARKEMNLFGKRLI